MVDIENIKNLLKIKNLTDLVKLVSVFAILFFIIGFLIWNFFLSILGFDEYTSIQTRFILTGALFSLIPIILCYILLRFKHLSCLWFWLILFIIWFLVYTLFVFPLIPPSFGGGQPRLVSIIATEQEIENLSKFGIKRGDGSTIQTGNLCIAYENNEDIIILQPDRILKLNKINFKGFGSLPDLSIHSDTSCGHFVRDRWIASVLFSWLKYK